MFSVFEWFVLVLLSGAFVLFVLCDGPPTAELRARVGRPQTS